MGEVATHRGRVMKRIGAGKWVDQRIEKAEVMTLRLVEQRGESRPGRDGEARAALGLGGGTAASARLADGETRVGVIRHIGYGTRGRRIQHRLIGALLEELAQAEAALPG